MKIQSVKKIYLLVLTGYLSISIILGSQSNLVTGKVVDLSTNVGISHVNLFIPKQNIGMATKEDGSFILEISPNIEALNNWSVVSSNEHLAKGPVAALLIPNLSIDIK